VPRLRYERSWRLNFEVELCGLEPERYDHACPELRWRVLPAEHGQFVGVAVAAVASERANAFEAAVHDCSAQPDHEAVGCFPSHIQRIYDHLGRRLAVERQDQLGGSENVETLGVRDYCNARDYRVRAIVAECVHERYGGEMACDDFRGQAYTCGELVQVSVVLLRLDRGPAVEDDVWCDFGGKLAVHVGAVPAGVGVGPNIQLASLRKVSDSCRDHDCRNE
jgi:hypothetical protein